MFRLILIGLAACLILAACGADSPPATGFITQNPATLADGDDDVVRDQDGRPYGYELLGEALPRFTAPLAGGGTFESGEIDTWTVIDVWGIWCSDCIADAPYAAALARAIAQEPDLDFVSLHVPASAARADEAFGTFGSVEAWFDAQGYRYTTAIDADGALRARLKIQWTPTYLLVSPDGIVRGFRTDLSVAGQDPVETFLEDIAAIRAATPVPTGTETRADQTIGLDGAGRLSRHTPFSQRDIAAAFAPLTIRAGTEMREGETYPVFHVEAPGELGGGLLFTVEPGWDRGHVGAVRTRHAAVTGPMGTRIGQTRLADLPDTARSDCVAGVDEYDGVLFCLISQGEARFAWAFGAPEGFDGYFPDAPEEVLLSGHLIEMRYLPPHPE